MSQSIKHDEWATEQQDQARTKLNRTWEPNYKSTSKIFHPKLQSPVAWTSQSEKIKKQPYKHEQQKLDAKSPRKHLAGQIFTMPLITGISQNKKQQIEKNILTLVRTFR